mgnify:FL=1|jgi:hypothetical protein
MVRVKGQLDAPLVDIGAVREGYWERKEVTLPSLARFHKTKGWFSWFKKERTPKVVLTRLGKDEFDKIDSQFFDLKAKILKDGPRLTQITNKIMQGKEVSDIESRFVVDCSVQLVPYMNAMLTEMIIEPKMSFDEVTDMMATLDDFDSNSLYAIVNAMTSEKARALKFVYEQRTNEMNAFRDMGAGI